MVMHSTNRVWRSRVETRLADGFSPPEEPLWPPEFDPAPAHTLYQDPDRNIVVFEIFLTRQPGAEELDLLSKSVADFLGVPIEALFFAPLKEKDWVRESLKQLKPIEAGRFFVFGSHDAGSVPGGKIPLLIEATLAFGTGYHETTRGCLLAIDQCAERFEPKQALDMGCGSGILAFAMKKTWPAARVMASDNDPVAIKTALENAQKNQLKGIDFIHSRGFDHAALRDQSFDLITANILSKPLVDLAPDMARHAVEGGTVVLSGLLDTQGDEVLGAYQNLGFKKVGRMVLNNWLTLTLKKT
jgi:ribosomal protein L11 methyltransferase